MIGFDLGCTCGCLFVVDDLFSLFGVLVYCGFGCLCSALLLGNGVAYCCLSFLSLI